MPTPEETRSSLRDTLKDLKDKDSKLNQILTNPAKANPPMGGPRR